MVWKIVMSMAVTVRAARRPRFSIPDRFGAAPVASPAWRRTAASPPRPGPRSCGARRHADQLGEAGAERAQRRAADREADLGDAEVTLAQQRHRPLDAARHQI